MQNTVVGFARTILQNKDQGAIAGELRDVSSIASHPRRSTQGESGMRRPKVASGFPYSPGSRPILVFASSLDF